MTASISGALIDYVIPDNPAWIPHRTVTHYDALKALERHLRRDCIDTGPVFHSNRISGNFFIASAGFCIEEATDAEWKRARELVRVYQASEHAAVYDRLQVIYGAEKKKLDRLTQQAIEEHRTAWERAAIRDRVCAEFKAQRCPLEHWLETHYKVTT